MTHYSNIREALREGEQVTIDGVDGIYEMLPDKDTGDKLEPGDLYVAYRNGPPQILTVDEVLLVSPSGRFTGWVKAKTLPDGTWPYSYDFWECVGVRRVDG